MKFSHLWMLRGPVLIISFLVTNIIFNCEITPCASHYLPSKNNSSGDQNFLANYLNFVLNKSREFEQTIYSDVIDNLRTLIKVQNGEIESMHECSKNCENIKIEKSEYNDRYRAGSPDHVNGYATVNDMPLNGTEEKKGDTLMFSHFAPTASRGFPSDSYFLGYSGNPFGSRNLIRGVSEMSQYDQGERVKIDPRKKRSVLHLYNMVLCSTGCNPFAYKGYGCYCGFLGSGIVVDGIDRCCKMHDWCYNRAGCPMFLEYFVPYLWKCYHRQPLCAIDHEFYGSSPGSCSQRLCECDRQLAMCLRSYPCPTTKALCTSSPWRLLQNIFML